MKQGSEERRIIRKSKIISMMIYETNIHKIIIS
jgi:hypothetical protein